MFNFGVWAPPQDVWDTVLDFLGWRRRHDNLMAAIRWFPHLYSRHTRALITSLDFIDGMVMWPSELRKPARVLRAFQVSWGR